MRLRLVRLIAASALAAGAAAAAEPAATPTSDAAALRFDIARYEVSGNTLLSAAEIEAAVRPYTGSGRNFGDVQQALEALEALYRARGYQVVTVQLPEQELNGGVVRLNVVQSRIGRILVTGNKVVDDANVRASMPTLRAGQTPDLNAVSANLRMANENPARKISLKLQNGEAEDEVDARLEVSDQKPWKAMLNLDNSGNEQTGKTQASVVLQHANLWGRDHVGSFQYTTTAEEPSKVSVYGLGYHIPLYLLGDSVDLFASYSDVDSGSVTAGLFNLAVSGRGSVLGARYNHTLARHGELDARLVYGLDIKAYKNSVLFSGENFGNDVTVHPLSVGYTASRPLGGGEASVALALVRNLPGGSRGKSDDFARARSGAKAGYTLLRVSGAFARPLGGDWQGRMQFSGQFSGDALVPGEQFGAGGGASVRGLDERAISSDSGAFVNGELYTPNFCGSGQWQCRAVGFVDAARGTRNKALPGEIDSIHVASAGAGLRVNFGNSMNLQLDYGHVVRDGGLGGDRNKLHVRVGLAY